MTEPSPFDVRTAIFRQWKVEYMCAEDSPLFMSVLLPFSSFDWGKVCMRGSQSYLGHKVPEAHALMLKAFHKNRHFPVGDCENFVKVLISNGFDDEVREQEDERWASFEGEERLLKTLVRKRLDQGLYFLNPLEKIRHIWHVLDGFYVR